MRPALPVPVRVPDSVVPCPGAIGFGAVIMLQNAGIEHTSVSHAAVLVAVWLGGWPSGVLAAIFGFVAADYLFVEPRFSFAIVRSYGVAVADTAMYLIVCGVLIAIGETMHRARRYNDLTDIRDMRRTTIRGDGVTVTQIQQAA